jgi:hypothetical protein
LRNCTQCHKPDAPRLEFDASCKGKCDPRATEDPATHSDDCPRISHEVVLYYKLVKQVDLVRTEVSPEGQLPRSLLLAGWKLVRDGRDQFRVKMLCRDCIGLEVQKDASRKEYQAKCAALLGQTNKSYSQMLAQAI